MKIYNFKNKNKNNIKKKYLCKSHNGDNISPKISWNSVENTLSYALILEDPDAPNNTFVHWYIPYISNKILCIESLKHDVKNINIKDYTNNTKINNNIKLIQGKNRLDKIGYYGPCAPTEKKHNYTFILYSLDGKLKISDKTISINDHYDFEKKLKDNKIKILNKESKSFMYGYLDL